MGIKTLKEKIGMTKILIVDDEPAVCNMLKKFLTKKGYRTSIALSGKEAIRKTERERPDIVLLDIRMPRMNGIETLQRIREINEKIAVIIITAVKDDETGKRCMELGAFDYITKPLGLEYLENVLTVKLLNWNDKFK